MTKAKEVLKFLEGASPKPSAGILFRHANEVLLVKDAKSKKWTIPSSLKEEKDSDLHATAIRSFREGCGMLPGYAMTGHQADQECTKSNTKHTTFLMQPDHKFLPTALDSQMEEAQWFALDKLPKNIHPSTKAAMDLMKLEVTQKPRGWK